MTSITISSQKNHVSISDLSVELKICIPNPQLDIR